MHHAAHTPDEPDDMQCSTQRPMRMKFMTHTCTIALARRGGSHERCLAARCASWRTRHNTIGLATTFDACLPQVPRCIRRVIQARDRPRNSDEGACSGGSRSPRRTQIASMSMRHEHSGVLRCDAMRCGATTGSGASVVACWSCRVSDRAHARTHARTLSHTHTHD